jgi:hypothetical protein
MTKAEADERGAAVGPSGGRGGPDRESQIRAEELCRMAAFRLRETANRIATLAQNANSPALHDALLEVHRRLTADERELLQLAGANRRS